MLERENFLSKAIGVLMNVDEVRGARFEEGLAQTELAIACNRKLALVGLQLNYERSSFTSDYRSEQQGLG
ncbi:MAG TPA: hypothetical protein VIS99_07180 [Terrimicrobiaceae bacterium]